MGSGKSRLFTIVLLTLFVCLLLTVLPMQVKAVEEVTNYNLSFIQTDSTVAMQNNLIITAKDSSSNTVSGYNGEVTVTSSDPEAILPTADITITNGMGTCSLYFGTAGTQSVTVTNTADNSVTGTLTVTVAPIHFSISVTPTAITAGESVNVTITALDASDTVLSNLGSSGYGASIVFTSTDNQAVFPSSGITSKLVNGIGVFNITLNTPGSQTITATNQAFDLVTATTAAITVNPQTTPTPTALPTLETTATPTPTSQPTPSPTALPSTPALTADNSWQNNLLIIAAVIAVVAIVAVLAVVFLHKKRSPKLDLPPPPPPPI